MRTDLSVIDILLAQSLSARKKGEYVWKNSLFSKLLSDHFDEVRLASASELQNRKINNDDFILIGKLNNHRNPKIRESCAHALGQICINNKELTSNALELLAVLASDRSPRVRATAVLSIGTAYRNQPSKISRKLLDIVHHTAKDRYAEVRSCTAMILCNIQYSRKLVRILNPLLSDRNSDVKEWAVLSACLISGNKLKMTDIYKEKLEREVLDNNAYDFDRILCIAKKLNKNQKKRKVQTQ